MTLGRRCQSDRLRVLVARSVGLLLAYFDWEVGASERAVWSGCQS